MGLGLPILLVIVLRDRALLLLPFRKGGLRPILLEITSMKPFGGPRGLS